MSSAGKLADRVKYIVGFILLFLLQMAFYAYTLLYKPAIVWAAVPIITLLVYVSAFTTRKGFRIEQILGSLIISILLVFDLFRGYFESVSGNSKYPLNDALFAGCLFFLVSNVFVLGGAWMLAHARAGQNITNAR